MLLRTSLALLAAVALSSCFALRRAPGITVASDPPGARVFINGRDTGFVTPSVIQLDEDRGRVDVVLDGYQTATRIVRGRVRWDVTHWAEMEVGPQETWRFPMWVDFDDFLGMFKRNSEHAPSRLFVRLRLAGGT